VTERLGAALPGTRHPLADGAFADAKRLGNLALRPPLLLEAPGLQSPGFFPVVRCLVHAWQSITERSGLYFLMSGSVTPAQRKEAITTMKQTGLSERRACALLEHGALILCLHLVQN
jgi:hypothetical protein